MVYRFGAFTLDCGTRQLLMHDAEVHLSPKAFELLTALLAKRPCAVSKTELQERLWPATFVEETNIAGLIAEIRRALQDPASHPLLVRTVYRFGYRFIGEVTVDPGMRPTEPPRVKPCLVFEKRQLPLIDGANVIGRAPDATIHIDSPGVSRYHARILVSNGEATLEELGSKNGTRLNGTRITMPTRLSDGNEIRLGTIVLTYQIAPSTGPTETVSWESAQSAGEKRAKVGEGDV